MLFRTPIPTRASRITTRAIRQLPHFAIIVGAFLFAPAAFAQESSPAGEAQPRDIRIIAPYAGLVRSVVDAGAGDHDLELKDTDLMLGLYTQWIRPGAFQANVFAYHAPDVNYTALWGLHSNLDFYFNAGPVQNLVLGGGLELISLDIDAGDNIEVTSNGTTAALQAFELTNLISVPFLRAGKQWQVGSGPLEAVIFPWAGAELLMQRGEVSFLRPDGPPGTFVAVEEDIDSTDPKALSGLNLRLSLFRFLQLDGKYSLAFDTSDLHQRASLMANLFFTRNLGVSYRWSYTETGAGSTLYNIFGVVVTW